MKTIYLALILLMATVMISCCPREGVDKSTVVNDYNLAISFTLESNFYNLRGQSVVPVSSSVEVVLTNSEIINSSYKMKDDSNSNLTIFAFPERVNEENINAININVPGYRTQFLDFQSLNKEIYQRKPIIYTDNIKSDTPLFCLINQKLMEIILPQANAFSCKTKVGSATNYRQGTLIRISLIPN